MHFLYSILSGPLVQAADSGINDLSKAFFGIFGPGAGLVRDARGGARNMARAPAGTGFCAVIRHNALAPLYLSVVVFLLVSNPAHAQDAPYPVEAISCPAILTQEVTEVEGETFDCGSVRVPADYDDPAGTQFDLMYGILKSTSRSPARDPVIYLHGGPGGGELGSMTLALSQRLASLRERRDIIVFDQRGSGFSPGEIECNDVFTANSDAAWSAAPEIAEASGMNIGAAASEYLIPLCVEHLNSRGVDLSQYNTVNNARDIESLARALELDSYNIYGHSYGTRLGLEFIRQNPPGLRSVLLDSVLPTDVAWRERLPETNEEAFMGIYGMCLANPVCAKAYPDLVGTLNDVFAQLAQQPAAMKDGSPITVGDLEQLILFSANQAGAQWRVRYLPRMIHDLAKGDTQVYEALYFQAYASAETAPSPVYRIPDATLEVRMLLNRANALARQADELEDMAQSLAAEASVKARDEDEAPAAVFLRALDQIETKPYSSNLDNAYAGDRTSLPLQPQTQSVLYRFIDRHFAGIDAEILTSLVDALEPDDIGEIYRRLRNQDRFSNSMQELGFALRLFNCNDSVPFNDADAARARASSYQIPGLTEREGRMMAYELESCDGFPTNSVPQTFHEPVTGDGKIPVMVFTGTNDIQTATSWAEQAADALTGSQFVRFPNTGHGATLFSQCARDVAAAFFDQPESLTNSECSAQLIPSFVLPDEPLP